MSKEEQGVWVLTTEYNDYDQHGEYLCCVWKTKPDIDQLAEFIGYASEEISNSVEKLRFLTHLEKGGGRVDREYQWYNLTFIEFGKVYGDAL